MQPQQLRYGTCGGYDEAEGGGEEADLVEGPAEYSFPAGTWCGVGLQIVRLDLVGRWAPDSGEEATFTMQLDVDDVVLGFVDDVLDVDDETELAFELGSPGWLAADVLGLVDGEEQEVLPEHDLYGELVAALQEESAAFDDLDGSGVVEELERDAGPLAIAADIQFRDPGAAGVSGDAAGYMSGCDASGGARPGVGWLGLLGLLGIALSRPRRT